MTSLNTNPAFYPTSSTSTWSSITEIPMAASPYIIGFPVAHTPVIELRVPIALKDQRSWTKRRYRYIVGIVVLLILAVILLITVAGYLGF